MKIILLNGPPRCGKDVAGRLLEGMLVGTTVVAKFAHLLKLATHGVIAILGGLGKVAPPDEYDHDKDDPHGDFFGAKPRDAYIAMSESFCKPLFGKKIFGKLMGEQMVKLRAASTEYVVITDCGFQEEVDALVSMCQEDTFHLVLITREDCDFTRDSRSYLKTGTGLYETEHLITNPGDLGEFRIELARIVQAIEAKE